MYSLHAQSRYVSKSQSPLPLSFPLSPCDPSIICNMSIRRAERRRRGISYGSIVIWHTPRTLSVSLCGCTKLSASLSLVSQTAPAVVGFRRRELIPVCRFYAIILRGRARAYGGRPVKLFIHSTSPSYSRHVPSLSLSPPALSLFFVHPPSSPARPVVCLSVSLRAVAKTDERCAAAYIVRMYTEFTRQTEHRSPRFSLPRPSEHLIPTVLYIRFFRHNGVCARFVYVLRVCPPRAKETRGEEALVCVSPLYFGWWKCRREEWSEWDVRARGRLLFYRINSRDI